MSDVFSDPVLVMALATSIVVLYGVFVITELRECQWMKRCCEDAEREADELRMEWDEWDE